MGNGPVPQQDEFGSDQPTLADVYRMMEELFDRSDTKLDEMAEEMYVCMYVCMVITYSRVWINRVRLPILLEVS